MSGSEKTRWEELIEARDALLRQISLLAMGPTSYGAAAPLDNPRQFRSQADDLRETLRQIEMEIAELPPSQRRRTPHPVIAHGHRLMDELGVGFVALVVAAPVIIFALIFARMLGILRY